MHPNWSVRVVPSTAEMLEVFTREAAKASAVLCDDVWLTDTALMAKAVVPHWKLETKDGLLVGGIGIRVEGQLSTVAECIFMESGPDGPTLVALGSCAGATREVLPNNDVELEEKKQPTLDVVATAIRACTPECLQLLETALDEARTVPAREFLALLDYPSAEREHREFFRGLHKRVVSEPLAGPLSVYDLYRVVISMAAKESDRRRSWDLSWFVGGLPSVMDEILRSARMRKWIAAWNDDPDDDLLA